MKVGAIIVTFNPDIDILRANIESLKKQVSHILIVDNFSGNISEVTELNQNNEISIIRETKNVGIAKATNDGIEELKQLGFSWALTMDQDSIITHGMMIEYAKHITPSTGLVAAIQKPASEMTINGNPVQLSNDGIILYDNVFDKARKIIASGSLIRITAWSTVHGLDNFLFIDAVDYDFNMKLIKSGFDILQVNVMMKHSLGDPVQKKVLGRTIYSFNHTAFRKFYIARNSMIMAKRYNNYKQELNLLCKYFIKIILVEDKKISKIISFSKGLSAGIKFNFHEERNK